MLDRDRLEKALIFNALKDEQWDSLVEYGIDARYFTGENKLIYDYCKKMVDSGTYPSIYLLKDEYDIDDDDISHYIQYGDIPELSDMLKKDYFNNYQKVLLNDFIDKVNNDDLGKNPMEYLSEWDRRGSELKDIGFESKSVNLLENMEEILTIDPSNVISTGFAELDEILVGLRRGEELVVIGGRPGEGKSWIGLKLLLNAALKGERVGLYSGEMTGRYIQERLLCCAKQNYTMTSQESLKFLQKSNAFIRALTPEELRRKANVTDIEGLIVKEKLTMIVIDQLSLMEDLTAKPGTPLRQQYGNISMDLFALSSKYKLPVVLLSQMNRNAVKTDNAPGLDDIAESDMVGQNATRVISLRNNGNGVLTFNIVKNRYGETNKIIKYEIDFGINKYKPIKELNTEALMLKKAKARQVFGGGSTF